jgi:protease II
VIFSQTSWTTAVQYCRYVPVTNQVAPTNLQPAGPYDHLDDLTSEEVKAPSYDGTMIPLSIVHKKGMALDGKNPTILYAYGSYGSTQDPALGPSYIAWYERGGILAVAHVRGGGEGGEAWHQAGFKLTKPNTWRDFIACGEYLVSQKYTSPAQMGILGGSAGGITVGRALTERPDLFAAAAARAGAVNVLRAGREPNGPPNIPEFGSDTTQAGFEDLYAMDALQHVRDGVAYPAVLLTTGINDPRVSPSEPAKFAARLQAASSSGKPVLLRVDYQGGHGIGASRLQSEELTADTFAFFLSQFGHATTAVNIRSDIQYGQAGGASLRLDAAVPDGSGPFPVALLVHGGGWSGGDKARDINMLFDPLNKAHVVWFSINYRLSPKSQWPACYDDVRTAIRWVKAHATEYKGDPNRIVLIGYSAGGELTCLAAAQAADDTKVKAAVGISSPTDMVADTERRGGLSPSAKALLGLSDFDDKARKVLGEMSALNYVHAGMPPFLLIHGNADTSVPYEQSIHFQAKLKAAGVACDLVTIVQGPHDISKWAAIDPQWTAKIVKWIVAND